MWNGQIYDFNGKAYKIKNRCGKVKEYNRYGELKFKGEYLNGEKWKGKEYDYKERLVFEGEYFNGKKWKGKITEYSSDDLEFEGELKNGEKMDLVKNII